MFSILKKERQSRKSKNTKISILELFFKFCGTLAHTNILNKWSNFMDKYNAFLELTFFLKKYIQRNRNVINISQFFSPFKSLTQIQWSNFIKYNIWLHMLKNMERTQSNNLKKERWKRSWRRKRGKEKSFFFTVLVFASG